jgi:hypothetical protein
MTFNFKMFVFFNFNMIAIVIEVVYPAREKKNDLILLHTMLDNTKTNNITNNRI